MTSDAARRDIRARRLAAQRLTGPSASGPEQVVGELLAVQSQDAPLARLGIALRAGCHTDAVVAAIDAGRLVRTHVLRPTWHYVLATDLPWLLELTSPRVVSGMASGTASSASTTRLSSPAPWTPSPPASPTAP